MPSRRRPKPAAPTASAPDPIEQFAAMIRQSDAREQAERERVQLARQQARDAARAAEEHAAAVDEAHRDLERAIADARDARRRGSGVAAADEAWRLAKARSIELETGAPPAWAPAPRPDDPPADPPADAAVSH